MKTKLLLIVIFFIFLFCNRSYSQTKVIDFPRFNSKVVSFSIEYQDRILESLKNRFTPDSSSIYEIEKYLFVSKSNILKVQLELFLFSLQVLMRPILIYIVDGHRQG